MTIQKPNSGGETEAKPQFESGATPFGSHYAGTWDGCERAGFFSFLAPHPKGGRGLKVPLPPRPLKLGGLIHIGLEHYYASGPRDPKARDVDLAVGKMDEAAASRVREWATPEEREEDKAKARGLLYDYHQYWEGDPDVLVVEDAEGPLIERNMIVEVPGCDTPFTCRPDAVVEWKGWVYVMEHKSSSVWGMNRIRTNILNSIQGSGECYTLDRLFPDLPVQGVLLNVLVKDRSSKSKYQPFERDTAARTPAQLEMFGHHHARRMEHIDSMTGRWRTLTDDCGDPWYAASQVFVSTGASTGRCEDTYGRPCQFLDLCKGVGMEQVLAEGFVAYQEAQARDGEDADS
jgi:hypothetical protein